MSRAELQQKIEEKYGRETIKAARHRLCRTCKEYKYRHCILIPITYDGKDCPYYEVKELTDAKK